MSYEPCNCNGKNKKCIYCNGTGKVFYEPEPQNETESNRAFGDSLQDYIK